MKNFFDQLARITCILVIGAYFCSDALAQGISRSSGLGLRGTFWKSDETPEEYAERGGATVIVGGAGGGGSIYFFSRLTHNSFLEMSIGAVALGMEYSSSFNSRVESSGIVPFLMGYRYDFLPQQLGSSFQLYLSPGFGAYWCFNSLVESSPAGSVVSVQSDLKTGAFAGGGLNVVLASWFLLNFDFKYHFVSFRSTDVHSGPQFGMGFCFMWGHKREMFRVERIERIVEDIYPAYYQFYRTYPLAKIYIKNTANYPIDVNLRSNIKGYSERTYQSGSVRINEGETADIPVYALFGEKLLYSPKREPAVIDIDLEARAGTTLTRSVSAQVIIHNRNAWDGEIDKLVFFVTPDDEEVLAISREIGGQISESDGREPSPFGFAKAVFHYLRKQKIRYYRDPNILFYKDDRVQFAAETLELLSGDCDDLAVLYSSLLESAGIKTAFVDVDNPEGENAHVYVLFDSGLPPERGALISNNEKRYILRESIPGKSTLWIPVETTLLEAGFEEAWHQGALQYLQEAILSNGIAQGWVRIIDVN